MGTLLTDEKYNDSKFDHCKNAVKGINGCGSLVVKVSDRGWHVMSSSPVPLMTGRVGERCTLNLSRTETSSRWCGEKTSLSSTRCKQIYSDSLFWNGSRLKPVQSVILKARDLLITGDARLEE
ncbi:hypothetical protein TNCV_3065411 [Trichonephila clavipes]|uniref:Uncharacterized protein n=1 Tax=Trichonephila clavipes TaxID=2585209 RepID=A0A8X6V7T6_TRICX|nr:hypothetical protein TNCV_3065411 [Trichonephila clavipes]